MNFDHIDLSKSNPSWNREEGLNNFIDWLHSNNVDTSNFEISSFDNYGFGLKATKQLAVIHYLKRLFFQKFFFSLTNVFSLSRFQ